MQNPQKIEEIQDDLSVMEAKADFTRANIFKWFILFVAMVSISCIVICFLYKFFTNSEIQKYILNQIIENIVFIGLSIFAILKINIPTVNK